jgi:hypothetical protein
LSRIPPPARVGIALHRTQRRALKASERGGNQRPMTVEQIRTILHGGEPFLIRMAGAANTASNTPTLPRSVAI